MEGLKHFGDCKNFRLDCVKDFSGYCDNGRFTYSTTLREECNDFERKEFMEQSNVEQHRNICESLNQLYETLNQLYEKKNADYGDSFNETYLEDGMAMARIRL